MAKIAVGTFTHWELAEQDILAGRSLPLQCRQVIQNDLASVAEQLVGLDYNPQNPVQFALDQAFLRGQKSVFETQLLQSDEAEKQLLMLARQSTQL
jgi:Tat protein secretion system quality control protein TatD with DNase activity